MRETTSFNYQNSDLAKPSYPTIDDALTNVRNLLDSLTELSKLKYPLAVRKGVRNLPREREQMKETKKEGLSLKAGATTYFFDIRETKQGAPYLSITESRGQGEDKGFKRTTINVFSDQVEEFAKIIYRAAGEVVRQSKAGK
jgi:hypothetical protein